MSNTISSSRSNAVSSSQRTSSAQRTHTVQRGDTMSAIARKNNVSLDELKRANPQVKNPDRIFPGQQLNIPERTQGAGAGAGSAATSRAGGAQPANPYQDGTSRFERGGQGAASQVQARPGSAAQAPAGNPALAEEVNARRASQNAAGVAGARAGTTAEKPEEKPQGPGSIHSSVSDGTISKSSLSLGEERSRGVGFTRDGQGRTVRSSTNSSTSHTADGLSTSVENREAVARNRQGHSVHSLQENVEIRDRNSGQSVREETRVSQNSRGRTRSSTEIDEDEENSRLSDNVRSSGHIFEQTIAGDGKYHGVATVDRSMTEDRTGAGYEAHALAVQGKVSGGSSVDLRNGQVNLGINASGRADLIGASGRAQVGSTNSVQGAGFVEGEAHVGARGEAGAGVGLDLQNAELQARVGVDAFAGAEVRATGGYENRYGGVSVTARGQAGIGGAAGAELSFSDGNLRARADLGAAIGLGGRITVDVNVNVGNIAKDAWEGTKDVASGAWDGVKDAAGWVGGLFD